MTRLSEKRYTAMYCNPKIQKYVALVIIYEIMSVMFQRRLFEMEVSTLHNSKCILTNRIIHILSKTLFMK